MAAPSPLRWRLPREARLQRPAEFARVRRLGRRAVCGTLIVNWLARPPGERARLGVVTARTVGSAVTRSRARRLLREVFRRHQHELDPLDVVLVARPSIAGQGRDEVERDFLAVARNHALIRSSS
jgi:ribonuclease P protein component